MSERWFSEAELAAMSRPTMERAVEAIDRGELERARQLCEEMKVESQFMHDMLVDGVAGLISYVQDKLGDEGVEEAWEYSLERGWKPTVEAIDRSDRRFIAQALAALSPRQRTCLVLRYYEDMPVAEIADLLGFAVGTAKRYLSDGIRALEAQLGPFDDDLTDTTTIETVLERSTS